MCGARVRRGVVAVGMVVGAVVVGCPVGVAVAAPVCSRTPEAAQVIRDEPWAQRWLGPDRVWALSRGAGVTVAVVDTGVDPRHPQLGGRVLAGFDTLGNTPGGDGDCDGHGTGVAGIIAAGKVPDVGFAGLAPDALVLPVRVADSGVAENQDEVSPDHMAEAIRWAADHQAKVVNVSIVFTVDQPVIRAAVEYAQDKGVLVVAAVGNRHRNDSPGPDAVPYPAAYPDVVGVGAIDENGSRAADSSVGPFVDLVAPGGKVTVDVPGSGHTVRSGTSFATPFVSATAALLFSHDRTLTADDVRRRLVATADPAPGPASEYGNGVLNPYRALTEQVVRTQPAGAAPVPDEPTDQAALARERRWRADAVRATTAAAVLGVLALLLIAAGPIARRGRRGGWRARRRPAPVEPPKRDDLEQRFYDVPRP